MASLRIVFFGIGFVTICVALVSRVEAQEAQQPKLVLADRYYGDEDFPRVNTPMGRIMGFWQYSQHGRPFESYEGVPYAEPPVGELRFQPPQPNSPWVGELPATKLSSECLQYLQVYDNPNERVVGAEDCLYLNVYVPAREQSSAEERRNLFPVIVNFHGGAFQFGFGGRHQPHYLMNKDVILVTVNYRLGPLGFLSTEDSVVPGNMGLKDQSMALLWVSRNIESFGGNPNKVTLTGLSAGGASVHYHYLSPMSRGLFHYGFSVSGTALDCWTQTEASRKKAQKLGAVMGCPTSNTQDMIRCLKTRPAKSIVEAEPKFMGWLYNPFTPFGPVVERNSTSPFINDTPINIIEKGQAADLPWITGVVTEEGLCPAEEFVNDDERMRVVNDNWERVAPLILHFNETIPASKHADVSRQMRYHYLGNKTIERANALDLIHLIGDRLFVVDGEKAARLQARKSKSPVRFYRFSYRGQHSTLDLFTRTKDNFGVCHADDIAYVFNNWTEPLTDESDLQMSEEMVNLWATFVTTGIPDVGVEWPPVDPYKQELDYLHIAGPGAMWVETNDNLGEKKFWSKFKFNENIVTKSRYRTVVTRKSPPPTRKSSPITRMRPPVTRIMTTNTWAVPFVIG